MPKLNEKTNKINGFFLNTYTIFKWNFTVLAAKNFFRIFHESHLIPFSVYLSDFDNWKSGNNKIFNKFHSIQIDQFESKIYRSKLFQKMYFKVSNPIWKIIRILLNYFFTIQQKNIYLCTADVCWEQFINYFWSLFWNIQHR